MSAQLQTQAKAGSKLSDATTANNAVKHHFSSQRGFSAKAQRYPIQAKLTIGQPGDKYEQEADRVADQVVRISKPQSETKEMLKTRLRVQRVVNETGDEYAEVQPIVHEVLRSPGKSLDSSTRVFMELRLGHDFSRVRVHTDRRAAESANVVNAMAYTVGRDIFFGAGTYVPETSEGRFLLAHELAHTIQQGATKWTGAPYIKIDGLNNSAENKAQNTAHQAIQRSDLQTAEHSFVHLRRGSGSLEEDSETTLQRAPSAVTALKTSNSARIQRRARALWPVDRWENPAARIVRGDAPAETALDMNNQLIQNSIDLDAAIPNPSIVGRPAAGGRFECRIANPIDLTCRNRRIMPWADQNGAWWSRINISVLQGLGFGQCTGVSAPNGIRFKLTARPSARALTRRIIQSEYEHVMDTFETFRAHLVPLHDRYAHHASNTTTGPDATSCGTSILSDINRNQRINDFITDYLSRQGAHDGPGGAHHTNAPVSVNSTCTLAHAEAIV